MQDHPAESLSPADHFARIKEIITEGLCSDFYDYVSACKLNVCSVASCSGENLLHAAIQSHNPLFPSHVVALAESQSPESEVRAWINAPMGNGRLTPLHLAAYKGRPRVVRLLIQKGAEIRRVNSYGMNVVHFASQNNQPWVIAFFKEEHNFPLDERDEDGNSPLHWACHFGSVNAAEFLLKWVFDSVNAKNKLGLSPLHLAVESALGSNSTRLMRILLFAGADRSLADQRGQKPIDIVRTAKDTNTYPSTTISDLEKSLSDSNHCQCLMLKIPLKKLKPNPFLMFPFVITYSFAQFVTWTVALPSTSELKGRNRVFVDVALRAGEFGDVRSEHVFLRARVDDQSGHPPQKKQQNPHCTCLLLRSRR